LATSHGQPALTTLSIRAAMSVAVGASVSKLAVPVSTSGA
jgi:hypothetical protein